VYAYVDAPGHAVKAGGVLGLAELGVVPEEFVHEGDVLDAGDGQHES